MKCIAIDDEAVSIDAVVRYIPQVPFLIFGKVMPGCVRGNEDIVRRGGLI